MSSDSIVEGTLEVPENRNDPNSRSLFLKYKVLKALSPDSLKAPIVYLQGGPGGATLIMEKYFLEHPLRKDRDIVLMDQRGTGESSAICTDLGQSVFELMRQNLNLTENVKATQALLASCKKYAENNNVDLAGYNSRENAADFEDLRKSLGYEAWNIHGSSYGTRLGLTFMRDFPGGIRSAVFAGVLPIESGDLASKVLNIERSLDLVFENCTSNPNCHSRFPDLKNRLKTVLTTLDETPWHLKYKGNDFVLNAHDAFSLIILQLYDRRTIGQIPSFIEALENKDTKPIVHSLQGYEPFIGMVNIAMHYSVMAYEEFPFSPMEKIDEAIKNAHFKNAYASTLPFYEIIADWHPYRAAPIENEAVVSDIPTLLISGEFDPATPPFDALSTQKHLVNGYAVVFENESHHFSNPCLTQIITDFIDSPFQKPNMDCSSKVAPIPWDLERQNP
ncbi:alpha/beta hydrolase [Sediminicola luteus]|nr:alpha/beta hydrolase [Sediminicola luteus]